MAVMETHEILNVLPHRYPMLLVDRVLECDGESRIVGIKNLTVTEPFFQGHFPGQPVMPGVLQLEAMAQLAGILINQMMNKEGAIAYFVAVDGARFKKVLRPGDQMRMEMVLLKIRMGIARVRGTIHVDGEVACEAEMMFRFADE